MDSRACNLCHVDKPLTEYYKDRSAKYGVGYVCKECAKAKARRWTADNKERASATARAYYEKHGEEIRARVAARVQANPERKRAEDREYYKQNTAVIKQRVKDWVKENPEKRKAQMQLYGRRHPHKLIERTHRRRARQREVANFKVLPRDMKRLYRSACIYCGSRDRITADHVVPIYRGGSHGIGNLVPACKRCNSSKGYKTIMEWRISRA